MYYASKPILRKYRWKNSKTQRKISNKNLAFGYFAHITQSSSAMWKDQSRLPNFIIVPQKSYKWPWGSSPCSYDRKHDIYDFPVHDYTQEQNGGSYMYFSSIVRQCKWLSLSRKIVVIQKFCYHGNLTSHFSFLSWWLKGLKSHHLGFTQLQDPLWGKC